METRINDAAERKSCGYNCAQAVACTYCDMAGLDEETVKDMMHGFGMGIGGSTEGTCGAIAGAVAILGAIKKSTPETRQAAKRIIMGFKEQNGTTICRSLKGIDDGVVKRACIDCVKDAAALLEKEL